MSCSGCGLRPVWGQIDRPVWEPLLEAVGERLTGTFMWMQQLNLEDGSKVQQHPRSARQAPLRARRGNAAVTRAIGGTLTAAMEAEVHRLSYQDVMRMVDAGVFDEDDRVELIDGVLVDMNLPGAPHSAALAWLNGHFAPCAPQAEVRIQDVLIVAIVTRPPPSWWLRSP